MPDDANLASANLQPHSIESCASWVAAGVTLAILSVAYGSPLLIVVGLRAMELDLGISRSTLALAGAMTWIGTGLGGIVMGWLADRIGVRNSVLMGTVMVASGLALSSTGHVWALYVGHGVLIGFLGMGAIYPPLLIYVSRWFDRRRGTAIALISSGQYVAGVVWPAVFERLIAGHGWRITYLGYAGVVLLGMLPLAALFLRPVPGRVWHWRQANRKRAYGNPSIPGASARAAAQCRAGDHLCGQRLLLRADGDPAGASGGVLRGHRHRRGDGGDDAVGTSGLRVHLAAVLGRLRRPSRRVEDRARRLGLAGGVDRRLPADSERGWAVRCRRRLRIGLRGHHPAYVVAIRDLFPSAEASWRIPLVLFTAMSGMAFGSWFAGVIYDHFGFYRRPSALA